MSSAIATPTDVIKVRMQAKTTRGCGGFVSAARDIYRLEGVRGLWRGVVPTAQRAALVAGVQLPVYDLTKERLCASNNPQLKVRLNLLTRRIFHNIPHKLLLSPQPNQN